MSREDDRDPLAVQRSRPPMTRRTAQRLGQTVAAAALLVGFAVPATRYAAMAVLLAGALLTTIATIRPDRGKP